MNEILCEQLALDYCCTSEDVRDSENHFNLYKPMEGRRRFRGDSDCFLKVAVVNGKALFTGGDWITRSCEYFFRDRRGEWFFEAEELYRISLLISPDGYRIKTVHPFFISDTLTPEKAVDFDLKWYEKEDIEQFRENNPYTNAYAFFDAAPDVLGVSAQVGDKIIGMAGASEDSPSMWQIGIDVDSTYRGSGVGTALVTALKNEIIRRGKLPFYGTALSHIASQRVAIGAGFLPAWAELGVSRKK